MTMDKHRKMSAEKAKRRMEMDTDRPDFMSYIMRNNNTEKGMTDEEIQENASILIVAGSEIVSHY
jgi:cytochrome P450